MGSVYKSLFFYKQTIKVFVSCFRWCLAVWGLRCLELHTLVSLHLFEIPDAKHELLLRALKERCVRSKIPWRVQNYEKGAAGRNERDILSNEWLPFRQFNDFSYEKQTGEIWLMARHDAAFLPPVFLTRLQFLVISHYYNSLGTRSRKSGFELQQILSISVLFLGWQKVTSKRLKQLAILSLSGLSSFWPLVKCTKEREWGSNKDCVDLFNGS